jgi:glutamate N-acetyltransferase/amino-acid N-acetyltransferase
MSGGPEHPVVIDPASSAFLEVPSGATLIGSGLECPGLTYPQGFVAAGVPAGLKESGLPDVGLAAVTPECRGDAVGAAVFTRNAFAAAPVHVSSREASMASLAAVVMNSGNANACTGAEGLVTARAMQAATAEALGVAPRVVGVASTGPIGRQLDQETVLAGIASAVAALSQYGGPRFAEAIMTTDRFPKSCALDVETRNGTVRLAATGKGAGMIAPGMATMLCAVTTDAVLTTTVARSLLLREVGHTFNRVSVDGQMSTNDCVFFMASGASGVRLSADGIAQLGMAMRLLLLRIALMMVADGEGATKVARLRVKGARTEEHARVAARAVADSTLVKTALYGGDPNWGRILSSVGAALPGASFPDVTLHIGGVQLVSKATAVPLSEEERVRLADTMGSSEVDIALDLRSGSASDEIFFSDLGHDYVTINAEYHT